MDCPCLESRRCKNAGSLEGLPFTCFYEKVPARTKPFPGTSRHPAMDIQAVNTAVEGDEGLVLPGFRRHCGDGISWNVRSIHGQECHVSLERRRKSLVQVAMVNLTAHQPHIAGGALHRCRIDVRGMKLKAVYPTGKRRPHRPGTAAEIHHDGGCFVMPRRMQAEFGPASSPGSATRPTPGSSPKSRKQFRSLMNQQLGTAAGNEHSWIHGYPGPTELGPTNNVLQWIPGNPPFNSMGEIVRVRKSVEQELRLLLREYAARPTKPRGNFYSQGPGEMVLAGGNRRAVVFRC